MLDGAINGLAAAHFLLITGYSSSSPALLLVGRDTLARADELVVLCWADLEPVHPDAPAAGPREGTTLICRSKTDQAGEGTMAGLAVGRGHDSARRVARRH